MPQRSTPTRRVVVHELERASNEQTAAPAESHSRGRRKLQSLTTITHCRWVVSSWPVPNPTPHTGRGYHPVDHTDLVRCGVHTPSTNK